MGIGRKRKRVLLDGNGHTHAVPSCVPQDVFDPPMHQHFQGAHECREASVAIDVRVDISGIIARAITLVKISDRVLFVKRFSL